MSFLDLWAERLASSGGGSQPGSGPALPGSVIGGVQVPGSTMQKFLDTIRDALKELPADFTQPPGTGPGPNPPTPPVTPPAPPHGEELPLRLEKVTAESGRVETIALSDADDISSIRILSQGSHGHVSVNPDNSIALVLSEEPGNTGAIKFSYEITYDNGDTRKVDTEVAVTEGQQKAGWSLGNVYMLEEADNGSLVIEHGDNHRKVYITQSSDGLTAAEIARAEGLKAEAITASWLAKNPEYGGSEGKALAADLGIKLWYEITKGGAGPTSNWLLMERGYDYDNLNQLVNRGAMGESALHPVVIGAYGEGAAPTVGDQIRIFQSESKHVVIRDIHIEGGFQALLGENILLDNLIATGNGFSVQNADRFTLRNSSVYDAVHESPVDGSNVWHAHLNRKGGIYIDEGDGVLLENNFVDHNGWADGYDYNLSADSPMPPSMYSHNFYLNASNHDMTFRDNITMRGASFGVQVRSGGFIEDNAIIDNNAAINFAGGDYRDAGPLGHYTLMLGNVVTSAAYKRVSHSEGALSYGIDDSSRQASLIENIVAHLADPNNKADLANKPSASFAYNPGQNTYFNDTIVYNWQGNRSAVPNAYIDGLSTNVLNQTTIQKYAAQLLDKPTATIADLANYLRDQANGKLDKVVDADVINAFFRAGFGLETDIRDDATTLRFAPDDRGDGIRWDNRLNWSTDDLPGTQDGDSVDLGGNRVLLGAQTVAIDDFIFRDFGELKVTSGRLDITGQTSVGDSGNLLEIGNAGQVWMSGYRDSDLLKIAVEGGRFANTGEFVGKAEISVSNNGQALLATEDSSMDLNRGSAITVTGTAAKVGFDGSDGDAAVLRLHDGAALNFVATNTGFGKIAEFRSGAFGERSDVTSGVSLDGNLRVDLGAWASNKQAANWTLIDADQIIGSFDNIQVTGLGSKRDALIRIDYVRDEVVLVLGEEGKGSGQIRSATNGDANFDNYTHDASLKALWDILHDQALPAVNDPLML